MKIITQTICLIILILSIHRCFANTYYVSPSGNNSNSGTINNPWKTINYSQNQLVAGDTLFVRNGVYVERVLIGNSGTSSNPISILAYQNENPIIDGQSTLPDDDWEGLLTLYGSYLHVSGFEIRNSNITGNVLGGVGILFDGGTHNKVSFMKIHHIREQGIIVEADNAIVEDCEIYDCALSNVNLDMSVAWANGISVAREQTNGITDNAIIRRCIVYNNYGEGIGVFEANNVIVEDCISYDNWTMNLYLSDATNCTLQRNICYNSTNSTFPKRDGEFTGITIADEISNGTSIPHSSHNTIINNFLFNANLDAFRWSLIPNIGLDNVLIANNTVVGNSSGFSTGSINDNIININSKIINNILTGSVSVPDAQGLIFSNNSWLNQPPSSASSNGDIIGDPMVTMIGSTNLGELTGDYFKLLSDSPCINSGDVLTEVIVDFFKNDRDNLPDIGGHEFSIPLSIEQNNLYNSLLIYPNPNNGMFSISMNNELFGDLSISLYNNLGINIFNTIIHKQNFNLTQKIKLNNLMSGIYYLRIITLENKIFSTKLIISNR